MDATRLDERGVRRRIGAFTRTTAAAPRHASAPLGAIGRPAAEILGVGEGRCVARALLDDDLETVGDEPLRRVGGERDPGLAGARLGGHGDAAGIDFVLAVGATALREPTSALVTVDTAQVPVRVARWRRGPRGAAHTGLILAVACIAQFMVVLDVSVVNVALPTIGNELHYSPTGLQWVVNAYVLTFAASSCSAAVRRTCSARSASSSSASRSSPGASLAGGLAQSDTWLTTARAVQGFGGAILSPATLTIIVTTFAGPKLARSIGMWSASPAPVARPARCSAASSSSSSRGDGCSSSTSPSASSSASWRSACLPEHRRPRASRSLDVLGRGPRHRRAVGWRSTGS